MNNFELDVEGLQSKKRKTAHGGDKSIIKNH